MNARTLDDIATWSPERLHALVYGELVPALAARIGRTQAEERLLRFKVLGGLGPAATADFLQELIAVTPAASDRQHLRLDIAVDPLMGLVAGESPLRATQAALDSLLAGGAGPTAFCLPCNSAHNRVPQLRFDRTRVTFVSMIDAAVAAARASLPEASKGPVGLLATADLVASGLYQQALAGAGIDIVAPSARSQAAINAAIYGGSVAGQAHAGVKGGDCGPASTALVQSAVDELCLALGAQAICLACTELPLVFGPQRDGSARGDSRGVPVVNATRALARSFLCAALRIQAQELNH